MRVRVGLTSLYAVWTVFVVRDRDAWNADASLIASVLIAAVLMLPLVVGATVGAVAVRRSRTRGAWWAQLFLAALQVGWAAIAAAVPVLFEDFSAHGPGWIQAIMPFAVGALLLAGAWVAEDRLSARS